MEGKGYMFYVFLEDEFLTLLVFLQCLNSFSAKITLHSSNQQLWRPSLFVQKQRIPIP